MVGCPAVCQRGCPFQHACSCWMATACLPTTLLQPSWSLCWHSLPRQISDIIPKPDSPGVMLDFAIQHHWSREPVAEQRHSRAWLMFGLTLLPLLRVVDRICHSARCLCPRTAQPAQLHMRVRNRDPNAALIDPLVLADTPHRTRGGLPACSHGR